jgi:hypothetical protein
VLLRNIKAGDQGPIWDVEPLDGWMDGRDVGGFVANGFHIPNGLIGNKIG